MKADDSLLFRADQEAMMPTDAIEGGEEFGAAVCHIILNNFWDPRDAKSFPRCQPDHHQYHYILIPGSSFRGAEWMIRGAEKHHALGLNSTCWKMLVYSNCDFPLASWGEHCNYRDV